MHSLRLGVLDLELHEGLVHARVEGLADDADALQSEALEAGAQLLHDELERRALRHVAVGLRAVEVVEGGQHGTEHVRDRRIAVDLAVALDAGAEVDELGLGARGALPVFGDEIVLRIGLGLREDRLILLAERGGLSGGLLDRRLRLLGQLLVADRLLVLVVVRHDDYFLSSSSTTSASTMSSSLPESACAFVDSSAPGAAASS